MKARWIAVVLLAISMLGCAIGPSREEVKNYASLVGSLKEQRLRAEALLREAHRRDGATNGPSYTSALTQYDREVIPLGNALTTELALLVENGGATCPNQKEPIDQPCVERHTAKLVAAINTLAQDSGSSADAIATIKIWGPIVKGIYDFGKALWGDQQKVDAERRKEWAKQLREAGTFLKPEEVIKPPAKP